MKKSKSTIIMICSFILMVGAVGAAVGIFMTIDNKNIHASAAQETLDQRVKDTTQGSNLQKIIANTKDDSALINSYLVDSSNIKDFVDGIESGGAALGANTAIADINDKALKDGKDKKITITVNIAGTFSNVMKVVKMIENLPYAVKVTSLSLSSNAGSFIPDPSQPKGGIYPWSANMTFDTYVLN